MFGITRFLCKFVPKHNKIEKSMCQEIKNKGEIVIYQTPDGVAELDVHLEGETVWLTQEQIAQLFGTKRPAITKHLNNIYKGGELEEYSTCSILEHKGNDAMQPRLIFFQKCLAI
ncbi:hypothetical protein FACS1894199_12640 [Bacteroidia bacterium]|nr:hypothetical protein FACS1894199_12640 [Bacteroidia bacterium]